MELVKGACWSGVVAGAAACAVAVLDRLMLGRDLHWGWSAGVGLAALVVGFAATLVIWNREE